MGTKLVLSFSPPGHEPFKLEWQVAWINRLRENGDNPTRGWGVRFVTYEARRSRAPRRSDSYDRVRSRAQLLAASSDERARRR